MKSVQRQSYFWSVFSPNTGKYGPEITPYLDNFHAIVSNRLFSEYFYISSKYNFLRLDEGKGFGFEKYFVITFVSLSKNLRIIHDN